MNIVLGITGSIAAIKSSQIINSLLQFTKSIDLKLVTTQNSLKFFSLNEIKQDFPQFDIYLPNGSIFEGAADDYTVSNEMVHIKVAKWANVILIAPATANFIAKLAHGIADDLLSTICLTTKAKTFVAPAMNKDMWRSKATQRNIKILMQNGTKLIGPDYGKQACGDIGLGRLTSPFQIAAKISHFIRFSSSLSKKTVLVTAGPTREPIDPVRFVSNRSSGKMGYAIAGACVDAGAEVVLVSGPVQTLTAPCCKVISVETAEEMRASVLAHIARADIFIACAAVTDHRPKNCAAQKIKSDEFRSGSGMTLELVPNPHVLCEVREKHPEKIVVGFAAETENVFQNAKEKLVARDLDILVCNQVGNGLAFESDVNEVFVFAKGREVVAYSGLKTDVACRLVDYIARFEK